MFSEGNMRKHEEIEICVEFGPKYLPTSLRNFLPKRLKTVSSKYTCTFSSEVEAAKTGTAWPRGHP